MHCIFPQPLFRYAAISIYCGYLKQLKSLECNRQSKFLHGSAHVNHEIDTVLLLKILINLVLVRFCTAKLL